MSDRWAVIQLQEDELKLTMLPGIGGRLWDVNFHGQSLLFQNPDLARLPVDDGDLTGLPTRSPQFDFPLWGGEKTWIAPDTSWIDGAPFPALDSGSYQVKSFSKKHAELTSGVCPITHLSITRRITLINGGTWSIDHAVTNHGTAPRKTGIWSVMMVNTPAKIGVALDDSAFHLVFGDVGSLVTQHKCGVLADCAKQQEFKIGVPNPTGETVIRFNQTGAWMSCSVPKPKQGDRYAHHYPSEIFNSGDYAYCEAEWHSPAVTLRSDETLTFRQEFQVWSPEDTPSSVLTNEEFLSCMS